MLLKKGENDLNENGTALNKKDINGDGVVDCTSGKGGEGKRGLKGTLQGEHFVFLGEKK